MILYVVFVRMEESKLSTSSCRLCCCVWYVQTKGGGGEWAMQLWPSTPNRKNPCLGLNPQTAPTTLWRQTPSTLFKMAGAELVARIGALFKKLIYFSRHLSFFKLFTLVVVSTVFKVYYTSLHVGLFSKLSKNLLAKFWHPVWDLHVDLGVTHAQWVRCWQVCLDQFLCHCVCTKHVFRYCYVHAWPPRALGSVLPHCLPNQLSVLKLYFYVGFVDFRLKFMK